MGGDGGWHGGGRSGGESNGGWWAVSSKSGSLHQGSHIYPYIKSDKSADRTSISKQLCTCETVGMCAPYALRKCCWPANYINIYFIKFNSFLKLKIFKGFLFKNSQPLLDALLGLISLVELGIDCCIGAPKNCRNRELFTNCCYFYADHHKPNDARTCWLK